MRLRAAVVGDAGSVDVLDRLGRPVAHAAYRRVYGPRATFELRVDDAYWHRGVPELVLRVLGERAAGQGISTLVARVGAGDVRLLAVLREEFAARETRDGAFVVVELATEL